MVRSRSADQGGVAGNRDSVAELVVRRAFGAGDPGQFPLPPGWAVELERAPALPVRGRQTARRQAAAERDDMGAGAGDGYSAAEPPATLARRDGSHVSQPP